MKLFFLCFFFLHSIILINAFILYINLFNLIILFFNKFYFQNLSVSNTKTIMFESKKKRASSSFHSMAASGFKTQRKVPVQNVFERFEEITKKIIEMLFQNLFEILNEGKENIEKVKSIKSFLISSYSSIEEKLAFSSKVDSLSFLEISGVSYRLICKIEDEELDYQDFYIKNKHFSNDEILIEKNENEKDELIKYPKLENIKKLIIYLSKQMISSMNFPINVKETRLILQELKGRIKKIIDLLSIIKVYVEEIFEIFENNENDELLRLIENYSILEPNQISQLSSREIKKSVHNESLLQNFLTIDYRLSKDDLDWIEDEKDKNFILKAGNDLFKKIAISRLSNLEDFNININFSDYFKRNCTKKFLHFFKPGSKFLYLYDLQKVADNFNYHPDNYIKIPLKITFDVNQNHKSLATMEGEIFILGAKSLFDESFYRFDMENLTLEEMPKMLIGKKDYGLCILGKDIYVVGGKKKGRNCSRECEKFDWEKNKWIQIAGLNEPIVSAAITQFDNRYIFKFGGINQYSFVDKTIERYSPIYNEWTLIHHTEKINTSIPLLYESLCCQINKDQILVFGGRNVNGYKSDTIFVFEVGDEEKSSISRSRVFGKVKNCADEKRQILSFAGNWGNEAILLRNSIYFLRKEYFD